MDTYSILYFSFKLVKSTGSAFQIAYELQHTTYNRDIPILYGTGTYGSILGWKRIIEATYNHPIPYLGTVGYN